MTLMADSADSEAVSEGGECCREEEELEAALDSYLRCMRVWDADNILNQYDHNRVIVYDDDDYVASRQFFPAPNLVRKGLRGCP